MNHQDKNLLLFLICVFALIDGGGGVTTVGFLATSRVGGLLSPTPVDSKTMRVIIAQNMRKMRHMSILSV